MVIKNHKSLCGEAKLYYYDSLHGQDCEIIPEHIDNHIKSCPDCRENIEQLRIALSKDECVASNSGQNTAAVTTMLELHFAYIDKHVTCRTVRPFLPALLDPALEIRIPTPITVHLDNCQQCSEDLKTIRMMEPSGTELYRLSRLFTEGIAQNTKEYSEMPKAVIAMASRADSEIITVYHVDESAKARQINNLYSGFPINVEVIEPKTEVEQPVVSIDFAAALKKKISEINIKPLLKVGFAAAAVIIISFMLFRNTSPVEAEGIGEMYEAIAKVENVYIATYRNRQTYENEIIQERWISNTLNVSINKTKKEIFLINVRTGIEQYKNHGTNVVEQNELSKGVLMNFKQGMVGCLGLIPFNKVSEIPPDSEWIQVENHPEANDEIEVYDLNYTRPTSRSHIMCRRRCFINSATFFPEKVEYYSSSIGRSELELKTVFLIHSIDEDDIKKVIQAEGFSISN
jgi:hypothetical protein